MEEIEVTDGLRGAGKAIGDVRGSAVIAALRRAERAAWTLSRPATPCSGPGDVLVAMGTVDALTRLEELFAPAAQARDGAGDER